MQKLVFVSVFLTSCIAGLVLMPIVTESTESSDDPNLGLGTAVVAEPPRSFEQATSPPEDSQGPDLSTHSDTSIPPRHNSLARSGIVTRTPNAVTSHERDTRDIIDRWVPRLSDRSIDLREEAVEKLAAIAAAEPSYRDFLIPILIDSCRAEQTQRIHYHIFDATARFPLANPEWIDPFLDLYLEFGNKYYDNIMYHFVFRDLWRLIAGGRVLPNHPRYAEVVDLAKKAAKYGENEARAVGVKILDLSAAAQ